MHKAMPPLSALRAFEAAARHLSLTLAARELARHAGRAQPPDPRPGRFPRRQIVRAPRARDRADRRRQAALSRLADRLRADPRSGRGLDSTRQAPVLVVSTSPGLTSKWLAPRLYRFGDSYPDVDVRISSSLANANFQTDGIDMAVRNMPVDAAPAETSLQFEKLADISYIPVCSPQLLEKHGPVKNARDLARLPLIHDKSLSARVSDAGLERVVQGRGRRRRRPAPRPALQQRRPCARRRRRRRRRSAVARHSRL